MAEHNGDLRKIPVNLIDENPSLQMRKVNKSSQKYKELVESIKLKGILNPILVREYKKGDEIRYGLIDGLHRHSGAVDAGLKEIPAQVRNLKDAEVLEAQIIANVQKIETQRVEYAKNLNQILNQNPMLTASELASRLGKSPQWLSQVLNLVKIKHPDIVELVNDNKIGLSNAYALAKLPEEEQPNYVSRAMTESPADFMPLVTERAKEIRDARRQGKNVGEEKFLALAHMRRLGELKKEAQSGGAAKVLLKDQGISDPVEVWKTAIKWAIHLDPQSVEERKQRDEERKRKEREKKEKEKAEKSLLRAEEATARGARLAEAEA
jgi:ParB/RepB/Spo0J family partition protein